VTIPRVQPLGFVDDGDQPVEFGFARRVRVVKALLRFVVTLPIQVGSRLTHRCRPMTRPTASQPRKWNHQERNVAVAG
jgi:hypothetical protein